MNIVLIEPEIPQNAGNIIRTCSATGTKLYMVKPLGFDVSDKAYKRAGLDYFQFSICEIVDSFQELRERFKDKKFYFASTKSQRTYCDVEYEEDCFICFGKETKGIDEKILKENYDNCIRIPMKDDIRSLNLSNSVAIILYEALRQHNFKDMQEFGILNMDKNNW